MDNLVDPTEEKNNDSNQTETSSDSPIQKGKEIARENDETEQPSSSELETPVLQDIPQSDNLDVPPGLSGSVSGLNNQEQEPNIQLEEEAFIGGFGTQEIRSGNIDLQPTTINNDQQPQNEVIEVIQNQTQTENASLNDNKTDNKTDQIDNQIGDQVDNQIDVNDQQSDQIENQDENEQYEEIKTQIYIQNINEVKSIEINKYFSQFGKTKRIKKPQIQHGSQDEVITIEFESEIGAESALKMNGQEFNGKIMNIKYALKPKEQYKEILEQELKQRRIDFENNKKQIQAEIKKKEEERIKILVEKLRTQEQFRKKKQEELKIKEQQLKIKEEEDRIKKEQQLKIKEEEEIKKKEEEEIKKKEEERIKILEEELRTQEQLRKKKEEEELRIKKEQQLKIKKEEEIRKKEEEERIKILEEELRTQEQLRKKKEEEELRISEYDNQIININKRELKQMINESIQNALKPILSIWGLQQSQSSSSSSSSSSSNDLQTPPFISQLFEQVIVPGIIAGINPINNNINQNQIQTNKALQQSIDNSSVAAQISNQNSAQLQQIKQQLAKIENIRIEQTFDELKRRSEEMKKDNFNINNQVNQERDQQNKQEMSYRISIDTKLNELKSRIEYNTKQQEQQNSDIQKFLSNSINTNELLMERQNKFDQTVKKMFKQNAQMIGSGLSVMNMIAQYGNQYEIDQEDEDDDDKQDDDEQEDGYSEKKISRNNNPKKKKSNNNQKKKDKSRSSKEIDDEEEDDEEKEEEVEEEEQEEASPIYNQFGPHIYSDGIIFGQDKSQQKKENLPKKKLNSKYEMNATKGAKKSKKSGNV